MKRKMSTVKGEAKLTPAPPAGGGAMSGERGDDSRPADRSAEFRETGGTPSGKKSMIEKSNVSEAKVASAKAEDVEDMREESTDSHKARHDMVIPDNPDIPPTIQQERIRMGQHPITGEPWTQGERRTYEKSIEQGRINHAAAVRESEERMRRDQTNPTPIQPITHTPTSFLTDAQKEAMQQEQDAGSSPARQAQARDANHPDAAGRALGEKRLKAMTDREKQRDEAGVDEDIENQELGEEVDDDDDDDVEQDADEVEDDLNK